MTFEFISNSPEETIEFGHRIGSQLKGGEIIGIYGNLGSGKTHLIKGIASGAGAKDKHQINSPTFVIVNEYKGRVDIYHIDAYRLNSPAEFEMIGFDDFCYPQSVVLIEWADKVESNLLRTNFIRIELSYNGQNSREIRIQNTLSHIVL
jgi:tRNA threonylcarbamoyladenosine biosynthesis protein TsaE